MEEQVEKCDCVKINVFGCRVNATATGCTGTCKAKSVAVVTPNLRDTIKSLELTLEETKLHAQVLKERKTRLQFLARGSPTGNNYVMPDGEAQVQLQALEPADKHVSYMQVKFKDLLVTSYNIYQKEVEKAGGNKQCVPTKISRKSHKVLQCGCQEPPRQCQPTSDHKGCEPICPAPVIPPSQVCRKRQDSKRVGQPGVDKLGYYCDGGCNERKSACSPVWDVKTSMIQGCQCQARDVLFDETGGPDSFCLPAQKQGDLVTACRCHQGCRIARNPLMAGHTEKGFDWEGLYCQGEHRAEETAERKD